MQALKDLEVGLFFWAEEDAAATLRAVKSCGVRAGQLGVDGSVKLNAGVAADWRKALAQEDFTLVTIFAAFEGESYADIPTVARTVGYVPRQTRTEREIRTREVIDFGASLGIRSFGCHVGCVPEERLDPNYIDVCEMVRRICDYAATYGMTYCLETGQEPAPLLLEFFHDVARLNLKINFDPANMVLYGSGEPIEAFGQLARHVISVHAKDGDWPDAGRPGSLGTERALGEGSVNLPRFVSALKRHGYTGTLNIESGVHGEEQRWTYLRRQVDYLRSII